MAYQTKFRVPLEKWIQIEWSQNERKMSIQISYSRNGKKMTFIEQHEFPNIMSYDDLYGKVSIKMNIEIILSHKI
jgi:hypothetical protein